MYVRRGAQTGIAESLEGSGTENPGRAAERWALLASSYLSPDPKVRSTELRRVAGDSKQNKPDQTQPLCTQLSLL